MKIPSSSSLIFATLAVSSSSTSLAAPTGEPSQANGELSSSSSARHIASRRASIAMPRAEVEPEGDQVANAEGLLDDLGLGKLLAPVLSPVCKLSLGKTVGGLPIVGPIAQPVVQPVDWYRTRSHQIALQEGATSASAASAPQGAAAWSVDGDSSSVVSPSGSPNTPAMTSDSSSSDPSSPPPSRRDLPVTSPVSPPSNTPAVKPLQSPVPSVHPPAPPIPPVSPPTNSPINSPSNPQAPFTPPANPPGAAGVEAPVKCINLLTPRLLNGAPSTPASPPSLPVTPPAPVQKNRRGVPLNPAKIPKRAAEKVGVVGGTSGDQGAGKSPSDDSSSPEVPQPPVQPPVKPPVQPPKPLRPALRDGRGGSFSTDTSAPGDDKADFDGDSGEDENDADEDYDSSSDGSS
ncbi:hypothetical protein VNI00_014949 [Paramarasmius palmivorus]|uniref:Uncharacterized protein n=1 Tax=Paramarasmius palmivorus TaxID=297713 RepID=A0AAW0BNT5_9AGAR